MGKRPWVPNGPEARLSIAVDRLLRRTLVPPFYCTAIHDSDGGERTMQQRVRDKNRGQQKGQLDWTVVQTGTWRALELKRGKNRTSDAQDLTIATLTACGFPPVVAWSLDEVVEGLQREGFRFLPNLETVLAHMAETLAGWDRAAEDIKAGVVVKKFAHKRTGPRFVATQGLVDRARKRGILV